MAVDTPIGRSDKTHAFVPSSTCLQGFRVSQLSEPFFLGEPMVVEQPEWRSFKVVEEHFKTHLLLLDDNGNVCAVLSLRPIDAGAIGNRLVEAAQNYRTKMDAEVKLLRGQ